MDTGASQASSEKITLASEVMPRNILEKTTLCSSIRNAASQCAIVWDAQLKPWWRNM